MRTTALTLAALAALLPPAPAGAGEISSVYTRLDLEKGCRLVASSNKEGGWAQWSCKGHDGMAVRVAEGDLRYFVSYGANAANQVVTHQTLGPFNTIHHALEWRVEQKGGRWVPFATILRYFWDSGDGRKGQTLVVTKLDGNEACHVAHIKADGNPKANVEARQAADTLSRTFDCKSSELQSYMR